MTIVVCLSLATGLRDSLAWALESSAPPNPLHVCLSICPWVGLQGILANPVPNHHCHIPLFPLHVGPIYLPSSILPVLPIAHAAWHLSLTSHHHLMWHQGSMSLGMHKPLPSPYNCALREPGAHLLCALNPQTPHWGDMTGGASSLCLRGHFGTRLSPS